MYEWAYTIHYVYIHVQQELNSFEPDLVLPRIDFTPTASRS